MKIGRSNNLEIDLDTDEVSIDKPQVTSAAKPRSTIGERSSRGEFENMKLKPYLISEKVKLERIVRSPRIDHPGSEIEELEKMVDGSSSKHDPRLDRPTGSKSNRSQSKVADSDFQKTLFGRFRSKTNNGEYESLMKGKELSTKVDQELSYLPYVSQNNKPRLQNAQDSSSTKKKGKPPLKPLKSLREIPGNHNSREARLASLMTPYLFSRIKPGEKVANRTVDAVMFPKHHDEDRTFTHPIREQAFESEKLLMAAKQEEAKTKKGRMNLRMEKETTVSKFTGTKHNGPDGIIIKKPHPQIGVMPTKDLKVPAVPAAQPYDSHQRDHLSVPKKSPVPKQTQPTQQQVSNRLADIEEEDSVLHKHASDVSSRHTNRDLLRFGELTNTNQSIGASLDKYNKEVSSVERHLNIVAAC